MTRSNAEKKRAKPWTRGQAAAFLRRWRRTGLTLGAYCRQRGICAERARQWRARLEREDEGPALRPVQVIEEPSLRLEPLAFEVTLSRGRAIRVPVPFDAEALVRLVAALERA
jgi:hypothetical protein